MEVTFLWPASPPELRSCLSAPSNAFVTARIAWQGQAQKTITKIATTLSNPFALLGPEMAKGQLTLAGKATYHNPAARPLCASETVSEIVTSVRPFRITDCPGRQSVIFTARHHNDNP